MVSSSLAQPTSNLRAAAAIFQRIVDEVAERAAEQVRLDLEHVRAVGGESSPGCSKPRDIRRRATRRAAVTSARSNCSRDRPERASVRMSSSVAVISSIVAIIRSRSSSGSTISARIRSEASGVRRSCADRAQRAVLLLEQLDDAAVHRVEGEDRVAQVGWARSARRRPARCGRGTPRRRSVRSPKGPRNAPARSAPRRRARTDRGAGCRRRARASSSGGGAGTDEPAVEPSGRLDSCAETKHRLARSTAPVARALPARLRVDRSADIA